MLKIIIKNSKYLAIATILINIFKGLMIPINTILIRNIIDVTVIMKDIKEPLSHVFIFLVFQLFSIGLKQLDKIINIQLSNKLEIGFGKDVFHKCSSIEYKYFEETETYSVIDRLVSNSKQRFKDYINMIATFLRIVVSIGGVLYLICKVRIWIAVLLILTAAPIWLMSIISSQREQQSWREFYKYYLKGKYVSRIINSREYIKEGRLYNYFKYVNKLWLKSLSKFQDEQVNSNLKIRSIAGVWIILQYIVVTGFIFLLTYPLKDGTIKIGTFIALAQMMWRFVGNLQYDIISVIRKYNVTKNYDKDLKMFFNFSETVHIDNDFNQVNESFMKIELKDVWFSYSNSDNYVLRGVSLTIHSDEVIALVGENGSGKSTLIKIILGLLNPTKGEVTVDNVPISKLSPQKKKKLFSVIFQDFAKYNITLKENIGISDLSNFNDEARMKLILNKISKQTNLLKELKNGLDTSLGKEIDGGVDLSGGQWQTVAIARALFANSSCIIMDEPTAALDPIAEADLYEQLTESMHDRAAIFVTHRLGSTRFADVIYTLKHGIIVEHGSHIELMEKGGVYAELFNTQKQWYKL